MKIGIDARSICWPINGIGRSLLEIGKELVKLNQDIIFYTPQKVTLDLNLNLSCTHNIPIKGKLFEQFWGQILLPYYAKKDGVELFWGPSHRLPYFLPLSISSVLTIHDLVWRTYPLTMNPLGRILDKTHIPYSIAKADKIMAISNSTKIELLKEFPNIEDKLSTIKLGFTNFTLGADFQLSRYPGISQNYILFVGTLEPRKNLKRLIEAYSKLPFELKASHDLVIVGRNGWGELGLDEVIKINSLSKNVKIIGYVTDNELASLYRHAIFLAMPSLYEGFGLPLLEAMSAGIPVVTSNCSSMPEISGNAALLVDPLSVDSIFNGLQKLLIDHKFREILSSNAKKNALKYSWGKCAKELMVLFENVMLSRKA